MTSGSSGFDYVGFERRFRGDSETVLATLADRYAPLLSEHQPVLDFGCGRGELVEVLAGRGIDAAGVDPDVGMVEEAVGHGRAVHLGDGLAYLRALEPHSLGALISVHVVEHLPLPVLVELLELAATRLRPGGIFIAETPNPMSLIVLGNSYILDPTHVWPLHPSLLTFLAERAGFRDVDLRFYSPADDYRLAPIVAGPDAAVGRGDQRRVGAPQPCVVRTAGVCAHRANATGVVKPGIRAERGQLPERPSAAGIVRARIFRSVRRLMVAMYSRSMSV